MPRITVQLETPIRRTFRVEQVAGMLEVPLEERQVSGSKFQVSRCEDQYGEACSWPQSYSALRHELTAEVPGLDELWTIGAIVGPSGSGKTTLARKAYGQVVWEAREWPRDAAIVDCLDANTARGASGPRSIKEIARVLTAVGLGSVPTWLKPYSVLSTGERFRAELARAVLDRGRSVTRMRGEAEEEEGETGGEGEWETSECGAQGVREYAIPSTEYSVLSSAGLRDGLLVFDEFTSSLDRTVAKTTSAALSRFLRSAAPHSEFRDPSLSPLRFVAVTCHDDILPWLAPDWVLYLGEPAGPRLIRQRSKPPETKLRIEKVPQSMWRQFARHHYLAGGLAASATCYGAWVEGGESGIGSRESGNGKSGRRAETDQMRRLAGSVALPGPVAFCAVVAALGWKKTKRITRLVVLPEFQGLGMGARLMEEVAAKEKERGNRVTITASHPAVLAHCSRSPKWRYLGLKKNGSTRQRMNGREVRSSMGRAVASFEWVGEG